MREQLLTVTKRKLWFAVGVTGLFALVDLLTQLSAGNTVAWVNLEWWRLVLSPTLAIAVMWLFLSFVDHRSTITALRERNGAHASWRFPLIAGGLFVLSWGIMFLHYWPLASMNDTYWILQSPLASSVQHPLVYNVGLYLLVSLGQLLGGSALAGVVFAAAMQILLWVIALTLVIRYLQVAGTSTLALRLLVAYFALVPMVGDYTFALVKDAVFSLFLILLIPILLHIRRTRGQALANLLFLICTVIIIVGFATTRNNGIVALVFILPLVVFYSTRIRRRSLMVVGMVVALALVPTVLTRMVAGPQKFVESIGVPLQMLGYAMANDSGCLPAASRDYFDSVLPVESWKEIYNPETVDTLKDSAAFAAGHLSDTKLQFFQNWAASAVACPAEFISGYLLQTRQLWRIDAMPVSVTGQSKFTQGISNAPGDAEQLRADLQARGMGNHSLLPQPVDDLVGKYYNVGMNLTPGAGTWLWLAIILIAGFAYRRRSEWIAIFAPMLIMWLTLLAAAPVASPFRYVQFAILVVPIGAAILLATPPLGNETASLVEVSLDKEIEAAT